MISWLTNTRSAKVCGLFSWLCLLDADWLGRQTPITWKSDWKICVRRQEMLQNSNDSLPSPPKVEVLQHTESPPPPPPPPPRPPAMIAGTKPKRRCQHTNELQSVFRHLLAFLHQLFVFLPQFFVFSHRLSFVLFSSTTETPWRN